MILLPEPRSLYSNTHAVGNLMPYLVPSCQSARVRSSFEGKELAGRPIPWARSIGLIARLLDSLVAALEARGAACPARGSAVEAGSAAPTHPAAPLPACLGFLPSCRCTWTLQEWRHYDTLSALAHVLG